MKLTIYPYWTRRPYEEGPRLCVSEVNLSAYHNYPSVDLSPLEIEIDTTCPKPFQFDLVEVDLLKKEKAELYQKLLQIDEKIGKLLSLPNLENAE